MHDGDHSKSQRASTRRLPVAFGKHCAAHAVEQAGDGGGSAVHQQRRDPQARKKDRQPLNRVLLDAEIAVKVGVDTCRRQNASKKNGDGSQRAH